MFDPNENAIVVAREMAKWNPIHTRVEEKGFLTWEWYEKYDAIFLTWSACYIKERDLVNWLKNALVHLNNPKGRKT